MLAAFGSLRWGELAALSRRHVDLEARTVYVEASRVKLSDGSLIIGPPKSAAAKRVVMLRDLIMSELATHIQECAAPGADGLVFVGPKGAPLRRLNFTRFWRPATRQAGLDGTHFPRLAPCR